MEDISMLEKKIGIIFENKNYLKTALTHSSFANEHKSVDHNERLEFLGDAVLGLVIAEYCYNNFQGREGELSRIRASVVENIMLAKVSDKMGLGEYLLMGKGEKENKEKKARETRNGNALEALIGAIFLDKDYSTAKKFVFDNFSQYINSASKDLIGIVD